MTTTRFWWIRHAKVTENQGKIYGQQDLNCDCSDKTSFKWLARILPQKACVITSTLKRTKQTYEATCAEGFQGTVSAQYSCLNEQCFGAWEGLSYDEVQQRYGDFTQKFWLAPATKCPPSAPKIRAESFIDLTQRSVSCIESILNNRDQDSSKDMIIFAHGGTIRAALAYSLGIYDPQNLERIESIFNFRVDNLSLTRIDHQSYLDPQSQETKQYWRILSVNTHAEPIND